VTAPLLVLHAWGDPLASTRWAALAGVWDGPFVAFDLPGHRGASIPTGGTYAQADAALYGDRALRAAGFGGVPAVIVGDSSAGYGAELLAAAGRAAALVLVDGLGDAWGSADEVVTDGIRWCTAVAGDPAALAPPPPDADVDPRLAHPFPSVWERSFTDARRRSIAVPVVAIETPASPTPREQRDDRLKSFSGPAVCVEVADRTAEAVIASGALNFPF
jgi:pimeloyl-ACP methyl ester carboxylesterase